VSAPGIRPRTQSSIWASAVALIVATASEMLYGRMLRGNPACHYHRQVTEQTCSRPVLQVPTGLFGTGFELLASMDYVVRIICVTIYFMIKQYYRFIFALVEGAGTLRLQPHSLSQSWGQVFSCFSQLTSYSHTAINLVIGRELFPLLPIPIEALNICYSES